MDEENVEIENDNDKEEMEEEKEFLYLKKKWIIDLILTPTCAVN